MKTTVVCAIAVVMSGCVSTEDYNKLDARLAVVEARYYSLNEDNSKIHDYLEENHTVVKKNLDTLKKSQQELKTQVQIHDNTIKGWQSGMSQ